MKQISIIGLSGSGKTCYIYAMAKTMKRGVNNIAIFTPNDILRDKLTEGWRKISKDREWPEGSDKITHCEFECFIHLRSVMNFGWDDYKGGILEASSKDEVGQREKLKFYEYLQNSTGLIFCISADIIYEILKGTDETASIEMDRLEEFNTFILKYKHFIKNISITIAITKSDLFENEKDKQNAFEIVKDILSQLFGKGNGISVLLVPVTLGQGLGTGKQGGKIPLGGIINADPKKGNIHLPIMFNLYFALKDYITDAHNALSYLKRELNTNSTNLSKALNHNWLQKAWYGENVDELKDDIENFKRKISNEEDSLKLYESDLLKVRNEFTHDCEFYINGELQKF